MNGQVQNSLKRPLEEIKDEEILALSAAVPSAFEALVDRYQEVFLRAAMKIVNNREEAEDIVQESFAKIYVNAQKFKKVEGASFKSWGYKIVINTSLTHYKKVKRDRENISYVDTLKYETAFALIDEGKNLQNAADASMVISRVMAKMPEHLGQILKKYYLEDKSQKDIAEEENISATAVKMRLFRAKKAFKKILEGEQKLSWIM